MVGYALSVLPTGMITFSGINKLMATDMMQGAMEKAGLLEHMAFIGTLEIGCVILYWIPRTSNLGFFLLASYVGGIIATEWANWGGAQTGVIVAVLLFVGTFLRKPSLSGLGI